MKKRNEIVSALLPIVISVSMYLVFYDHIGCKPSQAGFWIIIAVGISIGVGMAYFFQRLKKQKEE